MVWQRDGRASAVTISLLILGSPALIAATCPGKIVMRQDLLAPLGHQIASNFPSGQITAGIRPLRKATPRLRELRLAAEPTEAPAAPTLKRQMPSTVQPWVPPRIPPRIPPPEPSASGPKFEVDRTYVPPRIPLDGDPPGPNNPDLNR